MLEDLKLAPAYEGLLFLAEAMRNPPVLRPHQHAELELNLVTAGEITYVVEGARYRFPRRSLLWLFPAQQHQLVDRTSDAAYYVAAFKPDLIKRACRGPFYRDLKRQRPSEEGVIHRCLAPDECEDLAHEMRAIVEDGLDADLLNREAGFGISKAFSFRHNDPDWLNAGLRHILLYGWRLQQRPGRRSQAVKLNPAVRKALDRLEADPTDVTLAMLARHCGCSESFLSRTFRQEVGANFAHYRNSVRLGRFWEYYRSGQCETLLEAVFAAGFGSYAQFSRVFTAAYGTSPRRALATGSPRQS